MQHVKDQYFLDSANNISFFYEEGALDADGALVIPKERAINKIAHCMYNHDNGNGNNHDIDVLLSSSARG
jgi:hypothetical protein